MMLTGSKLKEIQVTLLLSSRAEMQKVIELARQTTVSFLQLSAPAIQPQPPIIPASLSGFLAQQMVQQNQHSPVMQPNIIPEVPAIINDTKKVDVKKSSRRSDRDRRSRSKSRDRRRRSRSRDRNSRRRDRSKSKDRRRSRRSKSRDRNRSRDRSHREISRENDRKTVVPIVNPLTVPPPIIPVQNYPQIPINNPDYIWDVPPNNFQGNLPFINNIPMNMPIITQMPPIFKPTEMNMVQPLFTSNTATFNKYDLPPQIPNVKTGGKSIKISNLDFSTSYSEIRRFFGSLIGPDCIKMINDRNGRRTGTAVILFQQVNAKVFAMQKNGQILKNSVIHVEDIDDNEYFNAVDNFKPSKMNYSNNSMNHQSNDDVVIINDDIYENNIFTTLIIEDIPSFTKEQDIMKMFSDITLKDVIIGKKFNELQAYAKFYRTEDAKLALNSKSTHFVGYKNVSVSICSDLAFDNAKHDFEQIVVEKIVEQKYPTDPRQKNRFTANLRNDENNWNENNETDRNIPDIRNLNFNNFNNFDNQNRFNNQNQNFNNQSQNNNFNNNRMNNRPHFNNRNRFNDNNQYNNRRNDSYDNSDDRQFNQSGNFHQRSYNNNFNGGNQQEFNQRFQNNDNQSFDDNYDENQNDNDDRLNDQQNNFNNEDENKIVDHDENSDENNGSIIVIPDDPTDDDSSPITHENKETIDEKSIIDENIETSMEEIHTEQQPIQETTEEIPNISDCIILQNLHSNTTEKDVIDFFSDIEIVPVNVHMLLDTDNQPSGDCFCEFNNVNDAERSLTKNNKNIGPNSIKIEFISRFKVEEIISSFNKNDETPRPTNNQNFDNHHQYRNDFPNFRRGGGGQNNYNNGHNNYNNEQNNFNNNYRGRGGGGGPRGGRFNNNNSRDRNNRYNSVGSDVNVLSLSNIPYRADTTDILDFFRGFDLTEDDVIRRFNHFGKPSDNARVIFLSTDEAREAFETCNGKKIGDREISIGHN